MLCEEVQRLVWSEGPERAPEEHVSECGACREEVRRAGDLLAALHGMQRRFAVVPPTLEDALMTVAARGRLQRARDVVYHPRFRWGAVGAAAAAATATLGVLVARRLRPELEPKPGWRSRLGAVA